MDLWQLHIFCKVIEHKSFSKAGKTIHLSQPTVSSHIKDLENHFSCRLIDRLGKQAVATKAGELLYQYARRLIALRDKTEIAMALFQGKVKGRLVIGGSTIPGGYILPKIIGRFTAKHPGVTIALIIGDTKKIIDDTISGAVEIGIVGAESIDKRLLQQELIQDDMRLIVPKGHRWTRGKKISLKMLCREPFIIRERGSGTLASIQHSLAAKGCSVDHLNVIAEMGSTEAVIQGIISGVGVSILSTIAVSDALEAGRLAALHVEGLSLRRHFYLTRHKYRSESPLCLTFVNFLTKNLDG